MTQAPSEPGALERAPRLDLQAGDEQLHPLMRHALERAQQTGARRFFGGALIPLKSARFLAQHREMWTSVVWPVLINLGLFLIGLYVLIGQGSALFGSLWATPTVEVWYHWGWVALWYLLYVLVILASGLVAYVTAIVVGGVLASPFNDRISEKTERALLGPRYQPPPEQPFWSGLLGSMASSAAMAAMYVAVMGPLLLLNLIPVLGSAAYTVVGGLVGGYFVALEYSDTLLDRHQMGFRDKLELVWRERSFATGFGVGTSLTMAIPLINFLCIPLAVIGGTAVGLALRNGEAAGALEEPRPEEGEAPARS